MRGYVRAVLATAAFVNVMALAPAARADDPIQTANKFWVVTSVTPKRPGYYTAAAPVGVTDPVPSVSLEDATRLADEVGGAVNTGTALVAAAVDYDTYNAYARTSFFDFQDREVFRDEIWFEYRQYHQDGTIFGIRLLPEKSVCTTWGGPGSVPYFATTASCWYEIGYDGGSAFTFVTGSSWLAYPGVDGVTPVVPWLTKSEEDFNAYQNGVVSTNTAATVLQVPCNTTKPPPFIRDPVDVCPTGRKGPL